MRTTRREFLKLMAAAGIGAGAPNLFSQRPRRRAAIIGAGLAGLAAAYRLQRAGWEVTIFESRKRLGGRVFSYSLPQAPELVCELGAEWVGESHTRIKSLCREFGIRLVRHQFDDFLLRDGKVLRPGEWDFSPVARSRFAKMIADYEKLKPAARLRLDRKDWWTHLADIGFTREDLLLRDLQDSTDFGESIRHISAYAALAEYAESSPKNEMDYKMAGGNSQLVMEFANRIGSAAIRRGVRISRIRQRKGIVELSAGDETFPADACICTVPVASLRKIEFDPPLPLSQQLAAERLTYARICKNSVLYDERFWEKENFSMITDRTSHYYFHSTQNQPGSCGILTAYAVGEKADVLASQSDLRRMKIITDDLADFNSRAAQLARGIASYAWQRDDICEGAYAVYRPGQWFGVRPLLARPHQKVLFAGEHLADWQGFMEGAIETGEAAADALIR
ncbi:MAG: FAD-dependent oxidoreductase [Blastocatellia bacterium]